MRENGRVTSLKERVHMNLILQNENILESGATVLLVVRGELAMKTVRFTKAIFTIISVMEKVESSMLTVLSIKEALRRITLKDLGL